MRTDALVNGIFMGFGLGFMLATLALWFPVRDYLPQYAAFWHFRFIGVVGLLVLGAGIGMEVYQRRKMRADEEGDDDSGDDESNPVS